MRHGESACKGDIYSWMTSIFLYHRASFVQIIGNGWLHVRSLHNGPKKCALIPKSLHEEPSGIYWRNDGHFPPLHSDQQLLFGCLGQTWHFDLCLLFTATNSSEMTAWARYGTLTFFEIYLLLLYVLAWLIYSKCCNFVFGIHEEPLGIYWRNGWLFPSWIALLSQAYF